MLSFNDFKYTKNLLNRVIKIKKKISQKAFLNAKSNIKKTWKLINSTIGNYKIHQYPLTND